MGLDVQHHDAHARRLEGASARPLKVLVWGAHGIPDRPDYTALLAGSGLLLDGIADVSSDERPLRALNQGLLRTLSRDPEAPLLLLRSGALPLRTAVPPLHAALQRPRVGVAVPRVRRPMAMWAGTQELAEPTAHYSGPVRKSLDIVAVSGWMLSEIGLLDVDLGAYAGTDLYLRARSRGWLVHHCPDSFWELPDAYPSVHDDCSVGSRLGRFKLETKWGPDQFRQLDNELFVAGDGASWQ